MSVAEILLEVTLTTFFSPSRDLFVVALYALVGFARDRSSVLGIFFFNRHRGREGNDSFYELKFSSKHALFLQSVSDI